MPCEWRLQMSIALVLDRKTYPPAMTLAMSTPSWFFSDSVSTMLMGMPMTTWPESWGLVRAKFGRSAMTHSQGFVDKLNRVKLDVCDSAVSRILEARLTPWIAAKHDP